jgi:hypothetical protein
MQSAHSPYPSASVRRVFEGDINTRHTDMHTEKQFPERSPDIHIRKPFVERNTDMQFPERGTYMRTENRFRERNIDMQSETQFPARAALTREVYEDVAESRLSDDCRTLDEKNVNKPTTFLENSVSIGQASVNDSREGCELDVKVEPDIGDNDSYGVWTHASSNAGHTSEYGDMENHSEAIYVDGTSDNPHMSMDNRDYVCVDRTIDNAHISVDNRSDYACVDGTSDDVRLEGAFLSVGSDDYLHDDVYRTIPDAGDADQYVSVDDDASQLERRRGSVPRVIECSICRKTFARQGHLVEHMRTHTDERPFNCAVCGRAFKRQRHVNAHMRTHR